VTDTTVQAGIYCRLSLAATGDTTKVDDQERICRELCGRLGWEVADVYCDNNKSAWRRNRKRPRWDAMLEAVSAGQLGAIVVYHGDRLIRQPYDLELLLNLAASRGIRLAAPGGTRDLGNPDDQFILRIEAAMACRESDNISRRKKQGFERMRHEGRVRPGGRGGRTFGFEPDGITHVPAETAIVRAAAAAVLDGEAEGAVARRLAAAGVTSPAGNPMSQPTLRKMLMRPRYAGLMPDGVHRGAWEPVLGRDEWEALQPVLEGRAAVCPRPSNAIRYLLSGIAVCGSCSAPLQIRQSRGRRSQISQKGYGCVSRECARKVHRSQPHLDRYVTAAVVARLADPELRRASIPASPVLAGQIQAAETLRAETEQVIESCADRPERLPMLMRRLDSIDARLAGLRERATGNGRARLLGAHADISADQFGALPLGTRRALVAASVRVQVLASGQRGPGFDPESVQLSRVPLSGDGPV
jgi:site-specific DNA recombinase